GPGTPRVAGAARAQGRAAAAARPLLEAGAADLLPVEEAAAEIECRVGGEDPAHAVLAQPGDVEGVADARLVLRRARRGGTEAEEEGEVDVAVERERARRRERVVPDLVAGLRGGPPPAHARPGRRRRPGPPPERARRAARRTARSAGWMGPRLGGATRRASRT